MAARSSARCITFDRKYLSGNTGNTFPFQHQFIWFLLTCFFFTNTNTWESRYCHCNQDTLHPRGPPHTSCYNTALAFVKLAVFTWPSAVVSKELRVKQFHFVANRHSHHMWPACQDANLAKSYAKKCQMLQIRGKFSTSDPAYIQHQLFHKEPVSVISCLIARDLRAVEHFDT